MNSVAMWMDTWGQLAAATPFSDDRSLNTTPVGHYESVEPDDLLALRVERVQEPAQAASRYQALPTELNNRGLCAPEAHAIADGSESRKGMQRGCRRGSSR